MMVQRPQRRRTIISSCTNRMASSPAALKQLINGGWHRRHHRVFGGRRCATATLTLRNGRRDSEEAARRAEGHHRAALLTQRQQQELPAGRAVPPWAPLTSQPSSACKPLGCGLCERAENWPLRERISKRYAPDLGPEGAKRIGRWPRGAPCTRELGLHA